MVSDLQGKNPMMRPTPQRDDRFEHRMRILLWGVLGAVLTGVMVLGIGSLIWREPMAQLGPGVSSAHLPVYGSVPDFTLIDQNGRPLQKAELAGKIWIANFIFANCPDECPLMTAEMARLQADLADVLELRLVSITVDPEHDTPLILSQYAARFQADPERWFFLTGDKGTIYRLAREGFRLGVVDPTERPPLHPTKDGALSPSRSSSNHHRPVPQAVVFAWPQRWLSWWRHLTPTLAFADHGRAKDTLHSTRFVLVDHSAQIRGYYDSREAAALQRLRQHLRLLRREP
jgi:cytochrome oxidase Cu insertion factor (SCO1/SenC/PrrC family)